MANDGAVQIEDNSPEHIAFQLFRMVADVERKKLTDINGADVADREWILQTYAECLHTVRNPGSRR